jgi:hypothetical protein
MKTIHSEKEQEVSWRERANFHLEKVHRQQQEATPMERRFLKALHWMRCPKCGHALATERHGSVDVDFCPDCRGVWIEITTLEAIVTSPALAREICGAADAHK